jgi:hypothetical protein
MRGAEVTALFATDSERYPDCYQDRTRDLKSGVNVLFGGPCHAKGVNVAFREQNKTLHHYQHDLQNMFCATRGRIS